MSDNIGKHAPFDAVSEGTDARSRGQRREACPYPSGSTQQIEWLQGFDGMAQDRPPDLPLDQTA